MQSISFLSSRYVLTILLILFSQVVIHAQQLPARWEAGMRLTITTGGGMRDYRSETIISAAGITVITEGEEGRKLNQYELTQEQLDKLLGIMRKYHFENLQSQPRKGLVYDMPTTTTQLTWGNHTIGYAAGASQELPGQQKKDASEIHTYIFRLVQSATGSR